MTLLVLWLTSSVSLQINIVFNSVCWKKTFLSSLYSFFVPAVYGAMDCS